MNREKMDIEEILQTDIDKKEKLHYLITLYGNDVLKISYIYLKNIQLAEDVTQDVFLRCLEQLDNFKGNSSYKTWVIRITVNRCKDVLKSWSYRNLILLESFSYFKDKNTNYVDPLHNTEDYSLSEKVMQLPIKLREVIILFYYEDFTIDEISKILKINPNTVKSRMHRGRERLKKIILEGRNNNG
ncbi:MULTISPECIES: sigma-70 family RNA polymerase sigma factor [Niallia]|nr:MULTISPECIES: sigma-70 family RNA polymerase sigma factor [Niallia]MCM3364993.1 sigma-70 family RNA polymerase sigma factor [Niallia sp. MER TA 168]